MRDTSDAEIVYRNCESASNTQREIDDATARVIASWYCSCSSIYEFVSTGAITDNTILFLEVLVGLGIGTSTRFTKKDDNALVMLYKYIINRSNRGPVLNWENIWVS
jgi:hypothetical protein